MCLSSFTIFYDQSTKKLRRLPELHRTLAFLGGTNWRLQRVGWVLGWWRLEVPLVETGGQSCLGMKIVAVKTGPGLAVFQVVMHINLLERRQTTIYLLPFIENCIIKQSLISRTLSVWKIAGSKAVKCNQSPRKRCTISVCNVFYFFSYRRCRISHWLKQIDKVNNLMQIIGQTGQKRWRGTIV